MARPYAVFLEALAGSARLVSRNEALLESNFFETRDLHPLAMLQCPHELAGFQQAVMSTGVKPGITTPHLFNIKVAGFQIQAVEVGNF